MYVQFSGRNITSNVFISYFKGRKTVLKKQWENLSFNVFLLISRQKSNRKIGAAVHWMQCNPQLCSKHSPIGRTILSQLTIFHIL